jgi:hypothetical protein
MNLVSPHLVSFRPYEDCHEVPNRFHQSNRRTVARWAREFVCLAAVACYLTFVLPRLPAGEPLSAADAAGKAGSGEVVDVRFIVRSAHPLLPGDDYRLLSTSSPRDGGTFVVQLPTEAALKRAGVDSPERPFGSRQDYFERLDQMFVGSEVRVRGKVEPMMFSSMADTRPGIVVTDLSTLQVTLLPRDVPPVFGTAVIGEGGDARSDDEWSVEVTVPVCHWEIIGKVVPKTQWPTMDSETEVRHLNLVFGGPSALRESQVVDVNGQPLPRAEIEKRLKDPQPVLISVSGRSIDRYYAQSLKPDTLVILLGPRDGAPTADLLPSPQGAGR